MGLDDILGDIRREGDEEVLRIETAAAGEAEGILAGARAEADREASGRSEARAAEVEAQCVRLRRDARAAGTQIVREAREDAYALVIEEAERRLAEVRGRPGYPEMLAALVDEALGALPEATSLRVDPRDVDAVRRRVRNGISLDPSLQTWGGAEVATADGRRVTNTLEARLALAGPWLRGLVAARVPRMAPGMDPEAAVEGG